MRYYTDCRETPSVANCTVAIFADSKEEIIETAMQHAVGTHGHDDTKEMRGEIAKSIKQTEMDVPAQ